MIKAKWAFLIIFILILFAVLFFFPETNINIDKIQEIKSNFGILAPIVFILFFSISSVFFMPITFLTIASGVIFGPFWGAIYAVISSALGACISFLISRYLLRDFVYKISPSKVSKLNKLIEKNAWELIIITTLSPFINFNLENYFFGVTNISLKKFFLATLISLVPGAIAFTYLGYTGLKLLSGNRFIRDILITLALFILISFLPYLIRRLRKNNSDAIREDI